MPREAENPEYDSSEEAPEEPLDLTGEEEEEEGDKRPKGRQYITRAGAERLHKELRRLLSEERPKVTAEVSAAAAQGDRSENAEYLYGKKRLREIDRRIRFLQRRLDSCTIVEPSEQSDTEHVYFGATVTLEDEDGQRVTYQLVGPDEIEASSGRISIDSPVGRALLRKKVGDSVEVQRPRGEIEYTIVQIRYV